MSFLDDIHKQPRAARIRLIWAIVIGVFIILVLLWVLTSKIGSGLPKDTSVFETLRKGLKSQHQK